MVLIGLTSDIVRRFEASAAESEEGQLSLFASLGMLVASYFVSFFVLYVVLRLSFVLPAVAVDESYGLADSWRQTKGQGWRMLFAMLLAFLPLWLVQFMALNLWETEVSTTGPEPGTIDTFAFALVMLVLKYLGVGLYVTLVSIAFRTCSGWTPCAPGQIADPGASGPGQKNDDT